MSLHANDLWSRRGIKRASVDGNDTSLDITSGQACIVYGLWYAHGGGLGRGRAYNGPTVSEDNYIEVRRNSASAMGMFMYFPPTGILFDLGLSLEATGATPNASTKLWCLYKLVPS